MPTPKFCLWCGNRREDHPTRRCTRYVPRPKPTCRVCGAGVRPIPGGRDDVCYRHWNDS